MQNRSAIRGLLTANFISGIAQGMSMLSVPMFFADSGQSNLFGSMYAAMTFITLFWAPYAGSLVDRYSRQRLFMILNIFMGCSLLFIAWACYQNPNPGPWALAAFGLTFWNYNLHYPCFYAFLQEVTPRERYGKIASTIEIQGQMASALAGAGAGLLLKGGQWGSWQWQAWDLWTIFALDASTYFIALFIIARIRFEPLLTRTIDQGSLWLRLQTGFNYLRSVPLIFVFGCVSYGVFITIMVHCMDLSPAYAAQHLGASDGSFAISEFYYALGAILSGFSAQLIFGRLSTVRAIVLLTATALGIYACLASSQNLWLYYGLSVLLGICNAGVRVLRVSFLMSIIPNQFWGRATSIFGAFNTFCRMLLLSLFSIPFFDEGHQIVYAYWVLVGFLALVVLLLALYGGRIMHKAQEVRA